MPQSLRDWLAARASREGLSLSSWVRNHFAKMRNAEELPTHGQKVNV